MSKKIYREFELTGKMVMMLDALEMKKRCILIVRGKRKEERVRK